MSDKPTDTDDEILKALALFAHKVIEALDNFQMTFWFCQVAALFLVLHGVRIFGVLGYRLAILIWLFAAVFCVCGFWVRYMTRRSHNA